MSLTEVLAEHSFHWRDQPGGMDGRCECGKSMAHWEHVPHIVEAIAAAGLAVVELPGHESDRPASWLGGAVTATHGLGRVRLYQDDHRYTTADARSLAAALLAAANAAEAGTS